MNPPGDKAMRGFGILGIVAGIILGYLCVYKPTIEALSGKPKVELFPGPAGASAAAIMIGLLLLVVGRRANRFLIASEAQNITLLQGVGTTLIAGLAFLAELWWEGYLQSLGYHVLH
jgi:hypothetical protein